MAKVRIHDTTENPWDVISDTLPEEITRGVDSLVLDSLSRVHEPGTATGLHLSEAHYKPGSVIEVHSHTEDEIIYVVEGSMKLGSRELKPGSSIFITAKTLYGFTAGSEGLRMVVFRPQGAGNSLDESEYMSRRAGKDAKAAL